MHTVSCKQEMQIFNLKWLFSLTDCLIFFKMNRVQAVDDIDKLCKFHKNLTSDADSMHKQDM